METQHTGKGQAFYQVDPLQPYSLLTATGVGTVTIPRRAQEPDYMPSAYVGQFKAVDLIEGDLPLVTANLSRPLMEVYNALVELNCRFNLRVNMSCGGLRAVEENYEISIVLIQSLFSSGEINEMAIVKPGDNKRSETSGSASAIAWSFIRKLTAQRQKISVTRAVNDISFLPAQCYSKCSIYRGKGHVGYAVLDTDYIGVYGDTVLKTTDYGSNWNPTGTHPFNTLGRNAQCVMAVPTGGYTHRVLIGGGPSPATYPEIAYSDGTRVTGGTVWTNVNPAASAGHGGLGINAFAMDFIGTVYAAADNGRIYRSKNVGNTWDVSENGNETLEDLNDITFYGTRGYAVGDSNVVLVKLADSEDWNQVDGPKAGVNLVSVEVNYLGFVFVGTSGGEVYRSFDGGDSWELISDNIPAIGNIAKIKKDPYTEYGMYLVHNDAGSNGTVYRSLDGGVTWNPENMIALPNNGLNGLFVVDMNQAFVCGELVAGTGLIGRFSSQA